MYRRESQGITKDISQKESNAKMQKLKRMHQKTSREKKIIFQIIAISKIRKKKKKVEMPKKDDKCYPV